MTLLLDFVVDIHKAFIVDVHLELVPHLRNLQVVSPDVEVDHEQLFHGLLFVYQALVFEKPLLAIYY